MTTTTITPSTSIPISERQRHLEHGLDPRDLPYLEVHPEVLEFGGYLTQPTVIDGLSID